MTAILIFVGLLISFTIIEFLFLKFNGDPVPPPDIPRGVTTYGEGDPLNYVVMGDSTAVGQGGDYTTGIATSTARHLATAKQVMMTNVAVSGARAKDVFEKQLSDAIKAKPDVVLIIVGSNDITHITKTSSIKQSITKTVTQLIGSNCEVKIILTGSAEMGAVPRLPQPLRFVAGQRVKVVNSIFKEIVNTNQLTFSPIAEKTGETFKKDHSLFAKDNFHPNSKGYDVWIPVISTSLDEAITTQPSHCK